MGAGGHAGTVKTDGLPTTTLANVVDDHLMEITHVLRGEGMVAFCTKAPVAVSIFWLGHAKPVPHAILRNPDKSKLSKRKNPTSINYYRDIGVLPEALLNYLGRMGWSMPDEREVFTFREMVETLMYSVFHWWSNL